ncbi:MAG: hypothetical protein AUI90_00940 [Deltaproteobacteria bacterium 13_1_40CM_3_69_14]|nr:MAG: hypothetical protein AUI90_00940 [Deltaproteobacteria bacterium 13_1_40CM_3_69_14]
MLVVGGAAAAQEHGHHHHEMPADEADLDGRNVPFARVEYVRKLGHDLVLPGPPDATYDLFQAQIGYVHRFTGFAPLVPTAGAVIDVSLVPASIEGVYGTRMPVGAFVFVGLQPPRMEAMHHHGNAM